MQTLSQKPMTCTYGYSHFRHFQNCCNRDGNTIFKYMNYVATDLEVHFSVLKKGVSQYFCLYSVCISHWCLVMSFWLKVCIYSHTSGVKLGLGLGFMQTSQVLKNWKLEWRSRSDVKLTVWGESSCLSHDVRTAVSKSMSLLISLENTISTAIYERYLINITYLS